MPSHGSAHYTIEGVDSPTDIDLVPGSGIYIIANDTTDTIEIGNTTDGLPITDHGALDGLADDDHPQYLRRDNNLSEVDNPSTSFNNISPMTTAGDIIIGGCWWTRRETSTWSRA